MRQAVFFRQSSILFLLSLFCCFSVFASELKYTIEIDGHAYTAHLAENHRLFSRIETEEAVLSSKHLYGTIEGLDNSWVRLSAVNGELVGMAQAFGQIYHLSADSVEQVRSKTGQSVDQIQRLKSASASSAQAVGQCASDGHQDETSAASKSSISASSIVHSAAALGALCAETVSVDGNDICLLAEIEFVFDPQFTTNPVFGGSRSFAMDTGMSIINMAEGFFASDLKILFDVPRVTFLENGQSPFSTSTNAGTFLDSVGTAIANNSFTPVNEGALVHVVTGRDFNGGTVGIAFGGSPTVPGSGVLCSVNNNSFSIGTQFGVSVGPGQAFGTGSGASQFGPVNGSPIFNVASSLQTTALIVAHELGHNFGSNHDSGPIGFGQNINSLSEANPCNANEFVMSAILTPGATNFSSSASAGLTDPCSVEQVAIEIASVGSNQLNACFNFPADPFVGASPNNPTAGSLNQSLAFDFDFDANVASSSPSGLVGATIAVNVSGGVLDSLVFPGLEAQTVSGLPSFCTSDVGGLESCVLPGALSGQESFVITATPSGGDFQINLTASVSAQSTDHSDILDGNGSLSVLIAEADLNGAPSNSPPNNGANEPADNTENDVVAPVEDAAGGNAGGSSGGGSTSLVGLLVLYLLVLMRRLKRV